MVNDLVTRRMLLDADRRVKAADWLCRQITYSDSAARVERLYHLADEAEAHYAELWERFEAQTPNR